MVHRWAIWFDVDGDLRFCSHHDLMRALERTARRSGIALHYSEGFNPRPRLSLLFPRPVGVASHDDLLVLAVQEELTAQDLCRRLNEQAPAGLRFTRAEPRAVSASPQPLRASFEMPAGPDAPPDLDRRVEALSTQAAWPVEREVPGKGRRAPSQFRSIDLRPFVEHLRVEDGALRFDLVPQGQQWARPGELLRLLSLDERADLARLRRCGVQYTL